MKIIKITKNDNSNLKTGKLGLEIYVNLKYAEAFLNDYKLNGGNGYLLPMEEWKNEMKFNNSPYSFKEIINQLNENGWQTENYYL